jgi:hypothetical protein
MRQTYVALLLTFLFLHSAATAITQSHPQQNWRDAEPKTITLFSRAKFKDDSEGLGKSTFSFRYGLRRDDVGSEVTRNRYEIEYGQINMNGDSDWFTVTMVADDCSRIKDLGASNWSDIFEVPILLASIEPQDGVRMSRKKETIEESSNGQVTRAVAGHMYVLHSKEGSDADFYTLFRVDHLKPSDEVTISWKAVPSPEKYPRQRP